MERLKSPFDSDSIKVTVASVAGMGITLSDINILFQILVGAASFVYICSKIWKLWTRKQHKKND